MIITPSPIIMHVVRKTVVGGMTKGHSKATTLVEYTVVELLEELLDETVVGGMVKDHSKATILVE